VQECFFVLSHTTFVNKSKTLGWNETALHLPIAHMTIHWKSSCNTVLLR